MTEPLTLHTGFPHPLGAQEPPEFGSPILAYQPELQVYSNEAVPNGQPVGITVTAGSLPTFIEL